MLGLTRGQASANKKFIYTAFSRPEHLMNANDDRYTPTNHFLFLYGRNGRDYTRGGAARPKGEGFPLESKRRELYFRVQQVLLKVERERSE